MIVLILFMSGVFVVCFFLTVVPKRPFVLTKTIEFSSLYDIESQPYELDDTPMKRRSKLYGFLRRMIYRTIFGFGARESRIDLIMLEND